MPFELHILGSNSAAPAHDRNQTAQLLNIDENHLLIDCGEGTQMQLKKYGLRMGRINHIFISHLHGDHYLGLMGLISTMHLVGRKRPLYVYGQKGLREIITLQLKYSNTFLNYKIHFQELNPDEPELLLETKKLMVSSFPLSHRIPCCGFLVREKPKPIRLIKHKVEGKLSLLQIGTLKRGEDILDDDGNLLHKNEEFTLPPKKSRCYAFCSDTKFNEEIVPIVENADLLYHEATFMNDMEERASHTFHSTAAQAAKIAKMANVSRLLIGHFSTRYKELQPLLEEAKVEFPSVELAEEGKVFSIEEE